MLSMEVGFQNIVQTIYTFQNPNKHQHIWSGGGGSTAVASCPSPMEGVTGPSHKPSGGGGCEFQKYFGHVESAIGFRFACVIRQWRTNANIGGIRFCPHGGSAWHLTHVYYLVIPWCFGFHSSASVHLGFNFHTRTHTHIIYIYIHIVVCYEFYQPLILAFTPRTDSLLALKILAGMIILAKVFQRRHQPWPRMGKSDVYIAVLVCSHPN